MTILIFITQLISLTFMLFILYKIREVNNRLAFEQDLRYTISMIQFARTKTELDYCEQRSEELLTIWEGKLQKKVELRTATMLGLAIKLKRQSL